MTDSVPALARLRALTRRRNALTAFVAESSPQAPGVDLAWEAPAIDRPIVIVQRQRRFPGRGRRGVQPVLALPSDLADGRVSYDSRSFSFDIEERRDEREGDLVVASRLQYALQGNPRDRLLVRTFCSVYQGEGGALIGSTVRVLAHTELEEQSIHYYTLFTGYTLNEIDQGGLLTEAALLGLQNAVAAGVLSPPFFLFSACTQSAALATRSRPASLFHSLPQVHRTLDQSLPAPNLVASGDASKGQFQRFIEAVEAHHHLVRGLVEGAADFHDSRRTDAALLPAMSQYLGWRLRDSLDEDSQRNEIRFAPEFYRTVGTARNIEAMVNRLTNWNARVHEFVRNLVVTFDPSRVERLSIPINPPWDFIYLDGGAASDPENPPRPSIGSVGPAGTVDTTDLDAMALLRAHAFEDQSGYTYDTREAASLDSDGRPTTQGWYSRQTIGIYIVPDESSEVFSTVEEFPRIGQIVAEFLPIQVRAIFVVEADAEEDYERGAPLSDEFVDVWLWEEDETAEDAVEDGFDKIPLWKVFITNSLTSRTVNVSAVDTSYRTWHVGIVPT